MVEALRVPAKALKKILIVSPDYPSRDSFAYGFVHERAKLYKKYYNINVYALVPLPEKYKNYFQSYMHEGIKVFKTSINYVNELVENIDPDIIAYHAPLPNVLHRLISLKRPLVLWFHGADVLVTFFHNYYIPFFKNSLVKGLISIPLDIKRNIQLRELILKEKNIQIVTISNWMKRMVIKYLALPSSESSRIYVIPNPVNTEIFKSERSCYDRNREIGIVVRNLNYKYGVDILLKALIGLNYVKLIIVGRGPLRNYLENIIKKYKINAEIIEYIPHEELPRYYNDVGFFVAPSRTEGQGVAMCEALTCGTPVVATNVGGIPEFVIHGYNGIVVNKLTPDALRKSIIMMIKMPLKYYCAMSQNAVSLARKMYSDKIIIPKELSVLIKAIEAYNYKYGYK